MKKINSKDIIIFLTGIVFLVLFIYTIFIQAKVSWFFNIEFVKTINPFDVYSLGFNAILAIFVAWFISKNLSSDRYEKEFIIKDFMYIEELIQKINTAAKNTTTTQIVILDSYVTDLNNAKDRLSHTLNVCYSPGSVDLSEFERLLNDLYAFAIDKGPNNMLPLENISSISVTCDSLIRESRGLIRTINYL